MWNALTNLLACIVKRVKDLAKPHGASNGHEVVSRINVDAVEKAQVDVDAIVKLTGRCCVTVAATCSHEWNAVSLRILNLLYQLAFDSPSHQGRGTCHFADIGLQPRLHSDNVSWGLKGIPSLSDFSGVVPLAQHVDL